MGKRQRKVNKEENFKKIEELATALKNIGLNTDIDWDCEWYCIDDKVHLGIEIRTNYDEDCDFIFTPDGELIYSCLDGPVKRDA